MDSLKALLPIIIQAGVATLILCVGLDSTRDDVLYLARRPRQLARAFVAISIVPPAAAVLVTSVLPLPLPAKIGVILMALSPVPPFVPGSVLRGGGRRAYGYGLYAAFAVLTVIIVPATVQVLNWLYGASAEVSLRTLGIMVLGSVLAPLAVGMAVRARRPELAAAAAPAISKLALVLLLAILVLLIIGAWPAMMALIGDGTVLAVVAISLAAIAAGHLMGGPDPRDEVALATAAATRHPGIALMVANGLAPDKRVAAMIILYVLVSFTTVALYQAALKRRAKRKTKTRGRAAARGPR
ncbi:MAG: bile acid:sodium symporter [Caulobacteraceae bacterium]|nr:bile acid:sodium symporter [Caulobacteraceae bacterium]